MSETSGLATLVGALAQNELGLITGVYGDPCTVLLDELARTGLHVEISVEEKTALAQALGASVAGVRAAVVIKQVGANVASDPLIGATTHGSGAGLLVIVGDDPGAQKSTVELDSRWYALLSELPVLTPQDPAHLAHSVREGIELSEQLGLPVLMQITARLLSSKGSATPPDSRARTHGHFERGRAWDRLILESGAIAWQHKETPWRDVPGFGGKSDVESPHGEWTRVECVCAGDRVAFFVNGQQVNEAHDVFPAAGKILLQCEGSEVFFRNLELHPLEKK